MNDEAEQVETRTTLPAPKLTVPAEATSLPMWQSQEILRGATEALILHEGQTYRLRLTRHGKLILYK